MGPLPIALFLFFLALMSAHIARESRERGKQKFETLMWVAIAAALLLVAIGVVVGSVVGWP